MSEQDFEFEMKLINLLLNHKELIEAWLNSPLEKECFDVKFGNLLSAISYNFDHNVKLTRKSFIKFLEDKGETKRDIIVQENLFIEILDLDVDFNDYPMMEKKIYDDYLLNSYLVYANNFGLEIEKKGIQFALKSLNDNLDQLISGIKSSSYDIYENLLNFSDNFLQDLKAVTSGEKPKIEVITCGIKEIDDTMVTGFAPGTLTLFCADVGSFKSAIMLNIGLNIWKKGKNVLFAPLEMSKRQLYTRLIAREAKINSELIFKYELTKEQLEKIETTQNSWKNSEGKFFIIKKGDRTSVAAIKRDIEKHIDLFNPDLVVIDYIANLIPDKSRQGRNDLEIGDMLKDLRQMGQKLGFAVVSGAQLGREALKRIRKSGIAGEMSVNSEDIRGSHEYAADADNIYAQVLDPSNPAARLQIYVVKARNGKKMFKNNKMKGVLEIHPEIGLIKSIDDYFDNIQINDVLQKVDEIDFDDIDDIDDIEENKDDSLYGGVV